MIVTKYLKLKKSRLIYYSLSDSRNYNKISKENLVQYKVTDEQKKNLSELKKIENVDCINKYSDDFQNQYYEIMKKKYKSSFSYTVKKKITDSTNTFIDCIKHNFKKSNGYDQRRITFVTLTIPENQKHTDKVLVKTLVDFIDHLKKVKNTLIENKVDTGKELLKLENYVWRAETTEVGNIHFHLLFDTYVNHITLKRVWNNYLIKLGYENGSNAANIHNLVNIKDVGSYVTKYLTKEPLNNTFNELVKTGVVSHKDLQNYDDSVKYRRPILYTSWGCSKPLKKLTALTFTDSNVDRFNELRNKCEEVILDDDIKDFVKVYKGKIYDLLNTCSKSLKNVVKNSFKIIYDYLYNKSDDERNYLDSVEYVHNYNFNKIEIPNFLKLIPEKKPAQLSFLF